MKKWILIILSIGIIRGIIFPDYNLEINLFIIPFVTPILIGSLSSHFVIKHQLSFWKMSVWGFISVYMSTFLGMTVYGLTSGWHYVTKDTTSQALFFLTLITQTIVYLIVIAISYFVVKRAITSVSSGLERDSGP